eukprot:Awhi_evm1s9961
MVDDDFNPSTEMKGSQSTASKNDVIAVESVESDTVTPNQQQEDYEKNALKP